MKEISYKVSVAEMWQSPQYQNIVAKIASVAPVVPAYTYKGESNIEEIKFKLAQREMHTLVMQLLKGE